MWYVLLIILLFPIALPLLLIVWVVVGLALFILERIYDDT